MNMTRFKSATVRRMLAISTVALLGTSAWAQASRTDAPPPPPPAVHGEAHRPDPARMGEHMRQRLDQLKAQLALAPQQEAAWTNWLEAGKSDEFGAPPDPRAERQALEQLTTPERIDRLRALRAQRDLQQRQREDATKTFYAQLNDQQKQVFDRETLRGPGPGHHGKGPGGPGGPGAPGGEAPPAPPAPPAAPVQPAPAAQ